MNDIPPSVLDRLNPDFMAGLLSGFIQGIERGRQLESEDMARLHAVAYRIVQTHAGTQAYDLHRADITARQIASCETQKACAQPWPDEAST